MILPEHEFSRLALQDYQNLPTLQQRWIAAIYPSLPGLVWSGELPRFSEDLAGRNIYRAENRVDNIAIQFTIRPTKGTAVVVEIEYPLILPS